MSTKKEKIVENGTGTKTKVVFQKIEADESLSAKDASLKLPLEILGSTYNCFCMALEKDIKDLGDKFDLEVFIIKFAQHIEFIVTKCFPYLRKEILDPLNLTKEQIDYTYSYIVNAYAMPWTIMMVEKYNLENEGALASYLTQDDDGNATINGRPSKDSSKKKPIMN